MTTTPGAFRAVDLLGQIASATRLLVQEARPHPSNGWDLVPRPNIARARALLTKLDEEIERQRKHPELIEGEHPFIVVIANPDQGE